MVVPHGIPIAGSKIRWFGCPPMTQRKPLPPIQVMEWQAKDWFGIGSLFILVSMRRIWKDFPGFSHTWIIILLTSCETQIREVSPPVSDPKKKMKRRQIWKSRWWLVRGLYYPSYIGDYSNPRTGNPYKPTRIKWNDSGILNTAHMGPWLWIIRSYTTPAGSEKCLMHERARNLVFVGNKPW